MYECICMYIGMHVKSLQSCLTLLHYGLWPSRLLCPRYSPGKNTGVDCHALLLWPRDWNLSLRSPAMAGRFFTTCASWETRICIYIYMYVYIYVCVCVCVCHIYNDSLCHPCSLFFSKMLTNNCNLFLLLSKLRLM